MLSKWSIQDLYPCSYACQNLISFAHARHVTSSNLTKYVGIFQSNIHTYLVMWEHENVVFDGIF